MKEKVSDLEVEIAFDKIFASGKKPTYENVRQEIGRGSYTDIKEPFNKCKSKKKSIEYKNSAEPIPDETRELIWKLHDNLLKTMWAEALDVAQEKINLGMFAVIENENQRLRDEIMHYKEMEVELRTIKEFQSTFTQTLESRIEKEKENEQKIQKLEKLVTDLLREKNQNK